MAYPSYEDAYTALTTCPRIQILAIDKLLSGKAIAMPPSAQPQLKQAEKVKKKQGEQGEVF